MKTIVVNQKENTRVPFLRGILTRSLLDTGLAFEDAFRVATRIRDELADSSEISSQDLRQKALQAERDQNLRLRLQQALHDPATGGGDGQGR